MKILNIALVAIFTLVMFSACAGLRDSKKYEMKKSPCACEQADFQVI